ncbi:MAG: flavodoxin [Schwartzia sp.]|uniref:flavodoxin n=1 Tax=Schwartzia succinivorans TaxID=55507 RepID=UPI0023520E6B|nr:flavodoxin [Schwartzia succinivorans]MBQ1918611.1 flavodoxin [Schwartzia sp. (in: firmicutes)]MBE6098003.1 flavodoxin [Schwartzia succinivorans]MBQ2047656.1 flavodoxin [Schwartzia sp. (in: firmicutes)]MBQ3864141.1 flavodoxin [Schwartzia sp. (in: firmicutes)]MDY6296360.1 flavodoxin [Schwartzia succinivorans]
MKKMFTMLVLALCALTLTACGSSAPAKNSGSAPKAEAPKTETPKAAASSAPAGKRALVVYFSRADENYVVGNVEKGNTRILAEMIAEATGADTFEIKPAKPYPKEYTPATEVAKQEKNDNARPEIVGTMPDVSGYDVVFVGYPIWWGDLPMPCYTFFDKVKLEGKTIAPFCTHEGSGLSGTDSNIANATKAKVTEALVMKGSVAQNSRDEAKKEVTDWLKKLGYVK